MKYILVDDRTQHKRDIFTSEFDSLEEAIKEADNQFRHMTKAEREISDFYVLESDDPDEDAPNHLDGSHAWEPYVTASLELYKRGSGYSHTETLDIIPYYELSSGFYPEDLDYDFSVFSSDCYGTIVLSQTGFPDRGYDVVFTEDGIELA